MRTALGLRSRSSSRMWGVWMRLVGMRLMEMLLAWMPLQRRTAMQRRRLKVIRGLGLWIWMWM